METVKLTNEDLCIFLDLKTPMLITDALMFSDRKDAALMRSAQRYYYARAICQFGGTEQDAIQVR